MLRTLDLSARIATLVILAAACSREQPAAAPAEEPKLAPLVTKPADPPKPSVEDTTFRLALEAPAAAPDQPATAELTLEARGGYHVNQEYPIRVDLKAPPGLKLEKTSFERADATAFSEERAAFKLPFTAASGSYDLTATVDFAVCTKETCVPDQRTVALALQVR